MKLKIEDTEKAVSCPKEYNMYKHIVDCRKECKYFNGYKTDEDGTRNLLCKFK